MIKKPKITVLMPVYNCELYIRESIDSILNQTFDDFELLIIDDASTDKTVDIIKAYNDFRIQLIEKPQNSGYTNSLNYGLSIAKGEYIARMDGDDISLRERFAKQVSFLDANPDVVLCGTIISIIGTNKIVSLPESHEDIKLLLLKSNCIAHPSVMFRNQKAKDFSILYDIYKEPAEDYDLWVRLLAIGKLYNLQEVLVNYRVHNFQVSKKRELQQVNSALDTRLNVLQYLDCTIEFGERTLLKKLIQNNNVIIFNELKEFVVLRDKLISSNSNNFFESFGFNEYVCSIEKKIFKDYFINRDKYFPIIFLQYLQIKSKFIFRLSFKDKLKLGVKSLIFFKAKWKMY